MANRISVSADINKVERSDINNLIFFARSVCEICLVYITHILNYLGIILNYKYLGRVSNLNGVSDETYKM